MNQRRTHNPVIFRGPCKVCGEEVEVHEMDYSDDLSRQNLVHFGDCLEALRAQRKEGRSHET